MMRHPFLLAGLLLASLLAGCSSAPPSAPPTEEVPDLELVSTPTTGIIRGVVVDDAIRPLANTRVTASAPGQPTRERVTGESGFFGFDGLSPGTWFLKANRTGYFEIQASTDVVAGVAEPAVVKIQLVRDVANAPYYSLQKFDGFLECGLSVIALCAVGQGLPLLGNLTNDRFAGSVFIDKPPHLVQSELVWQPTTAASDQLWLWHSRSDKADGSYNGSCNCWVQGVSPLVMVSNQTHAEGQDYGTNNDVYLRIFTGSIEGTRNPANPEGCYPGSPGPNTYCGGVGYSLSQPFTVYTTVFYGYLPPEGWLFVTDGAFPPP